jgi:serine/threonine protein kinase
VGPAAGPLPWADAARIGEQVARVLAATHGRGVIHGDVSPGNVVLTPDGVRVIDFGIAETVVDTGRPGIGGLFGTPPYVAPERLSGEPTQLASDVYALGALLFEMLTGRPPHPAITWADADEAQRTDPPPTLDGLPELPPDVARICLRCLDPDPANRPDASEVGDVLTVALAPAVTPRRNRAAAPSRRRFFVACLVAAAAVLVATGVVANCWPELIRPSHQHATQPPADLGVGSVDQTASGGNVPSAPTDPATSGTGTAAPEPGASSSTGHSVEPATPASDSANLSVDDALAALNTVIDKGAADASISAQTAETLRAEVRNLSANRSTNAAQTRSQIDNLRRKVSDGTREGAISTATARQLTTALDNLAAAMQQDPAR